MASPSSGTGMLCPAAARQLLLPVVVVLVALTRPRQALGGFREDEHTATVFNASGAFLPYHHDADIGKAAVARLLAALKDGMMMSGGSRCRSVGAGTTTVPGGVLIHGFTRCAAGIPCADCRRCLLRATEVAEREYNGSAGMQVLRLSCMARYESYPFYNATALRLGQGDMIGAGMLGNGKEVAVKRLKDSKRDLKELEKEIFIMTNLRHKNLLRLIGYCFEEERRLLVYEYVPNNSLEKFWHKAHLESQKLHWATWFNIIKGVAHGLQYLHGQGILHRDLKPHNVLLDENLNPKIADFDLMRVYDKEKTHESTEKVAECTFGRKLQLSIKSDVYSYGVLVLEIITGHKINTFEGENFEGLVEYVWQHWTEKKASDVVDGDLVVCVEGSEHERRQAERCVHMALLCVQSDRSRRPTMDLVIAILRNEAIVLPEPSLPGYIDRKSEPAVRRYLPCLS
ncbi:hypothetical protein PR202_gb15848 [Eleusine coracana subsp. coracana]|uniref:non-specific serine/threonine protein kinase n=1 Tax=Eleusine coracana subsp. coracana TaxID=191504 RepID=A0AAV5EY84_ELECO|nr:hypothetical protein PR202_gb15848 [Eleusine coracana subsp. coracana]